MVVGNNQVQAFAGLSHFLKGANATVHSDDDAHTLAVELPKRLQVETIALIHAIRDVGLNAGTQSGQYLNQQNGGRYAVAVKIAIDRDALPSVDGRSQAGYRFVHTLQPEGAVTHDTTGQKVRCGSSAPDSAVVEQLDKQRRVFGQDVELSVARAGRDLPAHAL